MLPTGISGTELLQFSAQHSREGVTANSRDSTSAKGQHAKLASFLDVRISGQALKDRSHRAVYSPAARSLLDQKKQELRQSYRKRVQRKGSQICEVDDGYLSNLGKHGKPIPIRQSRRSQAYSRSVMSGVISRGSVDAKRMSVENESADRKSPLRGELGQRHLHTSQGQVQRFVDSQGFRNSAVVSGSKDLSNFNCSHPAPVAASNLSRQFQRARSRGLPAPGSYIKARVNSEGTNGRGLGLELQESSTRKEERTDESNGDKVLMNSKKPSPEMSNRGLSLYDYYALQQDYKTQSPQDITSAVASTTTPNAQAPLPQREGTTVKAQIEPNKAQTKSPAPAQPLEEESPGGASRDATTNFKLDSLGATFALAAPEPNLWQQPKLSVSIKEDTQHTPCADNAPLQALYVNSGSQHTTEAQVREFENYGNDQGILQGFDAQNRIVWKAAPHNNIEVYKQGRARNHFLMSPQSGSPRRNNQFLCRQKLSSKSYTRASSQMRHFDERSSRQAGRNATPSKKLLSITQVRNQELKSFESKLKQVNQILGNQKLIQMSQNQSITYISKQARDIKSCKCALEDALISNLKQRSPIIIGNQEKFTELKAETQSQQAASLPRSNNRSVVETLKGDLSAPRTQVKSHAAPTGQSKPSRASLDGTGSFDYGQEGQRARLDARILSQEAEFPQDQRGQQPSLGFGPQTIGGAQGFHTTHGANPQFTSGGLGPKSSKTLLVIKNTAASEQRLKLSLPLDEDVVDYADPPPRDSQNVDNSGRSKESVKKTTISFFSKRNLSHTRYEGQSLAPAQIEGDAPIRETVALREEENLTEPNFNCTKEAKVKPDDVQLKVEFSGKAGQIGSQGEEVDSWKQSNHKMNIAARPGWVSQSVQSSGPFIRILEKQIPSTNKEPCSPLRNQRVRTNQNNRESILRLKQQLQEDDADFTNHEADSNGMVLESMRNYSQRQSEGFNLAGKTPHQDYGFGVAITSVSRKSQTPLPQSRPQVLILDGRGDNYSEEVDPSSLYSQSQGYRVNKQRNMAVLGNKVQNSYRNEQNLDKSRGLTIGMPSNTSVVQQMHDNYLRHKLKDHSKKQQIYSQQQKLMKFSQTHQTSERSKGNFFSAIPQSSTRNLQKPDLNQSIRQIDIGVKKPAGLQSQGKTVLHFLNKDISHDKHKTQKFELGDRGLGSFESNYRPSEGNLDASQMSQGKKIASEFRSDSALDVDQKRFYYKNEDIELLSYTQSQVGIGDMKLFSASKMNKDLNIKSSGQKPKNGFNVKRQSLDTDIQLNNQFADVIQTKINTDTTERAIGDPSPKDEVSAHSSWQMKAKQPFGSNYQFAPDQNGNIAYKRIFEIPSRTNVDPNLFLFDNCDRQYFRKNGRLFPKKNFRPKQQHSQETNPHTSKTTSPKINSPPRKPKMCSSPNNQELIVADSVNDRTTEPDEIRPIKVKQQLEGSGDQYFGEYASQHDNQEFKINVGQLDPKDFLPISFRKQDFGEAGKRSSRKSSVHQHPNNSQEYNTLGNQTAGQGVSRLQNPQIGQISGQDRLMNIQQEDSYEIHANQSNPPNGTAERERQLQLITDNDQILSQQTEQLSAGNRWLLKNKYDKASSRRSSKLIQNVLESPTDALSPAFGPYSPAGNSQITSQKRSLITHSQSNTPIKSSQVLDQKLL